LELRQEVLDGFGFAFGVFVGLMKSVGRFVDLHCCSATLDDKAGDVKDVAGQDEATDGIHGTDDIDTLTSRNGLIAITDEFDGPPRIQMPKGRGENHEGETQVQRDANMHDGRRLGGRRQNPGFDWLVYHGEALVVPKHSTIRARCASQIRLP
jgi:hypothetical protein